MTQPSINRILAAAAAAAVAVGALAACSGSNEGDAQSSATAKNSSQTIHYLSARPQTEAQSQVLEHIAAEYKAENPDFDLIIEYIPDRPSYLQKVKILATSNELPEWFDADPEPYFQDIVDSGAVADIGAVYDELGIRDKFFPISIEYPTMADGSLNLMTWNANAEYFFYNKDVFAEAGISEPATLQDVSELCDKARAVGKDGIALAGANQWPYFRFLAMPAFRLTGNSFIMELSKGEATMTDSVGIDSSTYLEDLGMRCFQEGHTTTDSDTAVNLMMNGEAAMYYTGTWDIPKFIDDNGDLKPNIGWFTMPKWGADDTTPPTDFFVNSGIGTAIRADAMDDNMKAWLEFLFQRYADVSMYEYDSIPSLVPEIRDDLGAAYKTILADIEGVTDYARVWDVVLDPNTVDTLGRESERITLGDITPEQFGATVDSAINKYISQTR